MKEVKGNIWTYPSDYKCITTNCALRKNGNAVMGAGIALQAKLRYPDIEAVLGRHIKLHAFGVGVCLIGHNLIAFPTKHSYRDNFSDINLIKKSAIELKELSKSLPKKSIITLPRPGCSNGNLKWSIVKPILESILTEDNFVIVDKGE